MEYFSDLLAYREIGVLILRAVVGYVLVFHGWLKLRMGTACAGESVATLRSLRLPFPAAIVRIVGGVETVGGAAYILGVGVPIAAVALTFLMAVLLAGKVVVMRRPFSGTYGYEFVFILLAVSIFLATNGAGVYALWR